MAHILIIGPIFQNLCNYLAKNNHTFTSIKSPTLYETDESLFEIVHQLQSQNPIHAVITTYENFIPHTSKIANHLNLPALPLEAAAASTNKFLMRQHFATAPEKISPDFAIVHDQTDLINFAKSHSFPLILKPTNLCKSLLVTKNHSLPELLENYTQTLQNAPATYAQYAPHLPPQFIVEEFLSGPMYAIEGFIDSNGTPHLLGPAAITEIRTARDIGHDDSFLYSRLLPSNLTKSQANQILHIATLGCKSLNLKNTPAHIELMFTPDGPRILEIGARLGGYRERMHYLSNNLDLYALHLATAQGHPLKIPPHSATPLAVYELFPKTTGLFHSIANESKLKSLPSLRYYSLKAKPNTKIGKASTGHKATAVIILHHSDPTQFAKDRHFLETSVEVLTV